MQCEYCGNVNLAGAKSCFYCQRVLPFTIVYRFEEPAHPAQQPVQTAWLKERYQIVECIGKGGFGSVYKAYDMVYNGAAVAIKEINLRGVHTKDLVDSIDAFHREVEVLSELHHPNLPRMYDHFVERLHWYLVMDFIEGETLAQRLEQTIGGRFLNVADVLNVGMQLCTVLDYMHTHRPPIIFRDLKPSNVMLTPGGQIYLIDFGISRSFKPGQLYDTMALGSPGYAAPEQYGKSQTTTRTDIYSLGALLHHLLTGADPSDTPFRFKPIRSYRLNYPYTSALAQLDEFVMHMVDIDPDQRPGSMAMIKQQLSYITELLLAAQREVRW
jgi:serine/threonine protein kinase